MANSLKTLIVPSKGKHTATVIFMHGLGDSGYGWKPVAEQLSRDQSLQHVKWVLPHAPTVPCTANGGMIMPAWFDIFSFGFKGPEDETGILRSKEEVNELIKKEVTEGIPTNRIVLGGFSQGAAMTLVTGLTTQHQLAGLTVLSGWFAIKEKVKELRQSPETSKSPAAFKSPATSIPIFWGHGEDDPLVPLSLGKQSKEELKKVGVNEAKESGEPGTFFHAYPDLGHSADAQEINDWANWLKKVVPPA